MPTRPAQEGEAIFLYAAEPGADFAACSLTPHFCDDFLDPRSERAGDMGWTAGAGEPGLWGVRDGWLWQDEPGPGRRSVIKGDPMFSFEASCQLQLAGAVRAGLLLACSASGHAAAVLLSPHPEGGAVLTVAAGSECEPQPVSQHLPDVLPEEPVALHCELRERQLTVWVAGSPAVAMEIASGEGCLGLVTDDGAAAFTDVAMTWLPSE